MSDRDDPRRRIPRTDALLAELSEAVTTHGYDVVRAAIGSAQDGARQGDVAPEDVATHARSLLPARRSSMVPVINATGIVVHTNIGRAPLSEAAVDAMVDAAGYVDVEFDLERGDRATRGRGTLAALAERVPEAGGVLVVNNGAAALVLATTALAAGREVIVSRGEMVEIGDGFRLPALIESTGAVLREVGTTNRTSRADYAAAINDRTGCILKVHPSNFRIDGFTSAATVADLADLGVPLVVDIGSGLLQPDRLLPDEPDVATTLSHGAHLVTASGDKLLGGPQAGLLFGEAELVQRLRRHPLARALRVDKLTLAALEATLRGPQPPVTTYLHEGADSLRRKTITLATDLGLSEDDVVEVEGHVGGGGAPGVPLPGWALSLPEKIALALRTGEPTVLARIARGRCLVDLRCVAGNQYDDLVRALRRALTAG